jgi:hypothetical protein
MTTKTREQTITIPKTTITVEPIEIPIDWAVVGPRVVASVKEAIARASVPSATAHPLGEAHARQARIIQEAFAAMLAAELLADAGQVPGSVVRGLQQSAQIEARRHTERQARDRAKV